MYQQCEWTNLRNDIRTHIKVYDFFQKNKKQNLKCGILKIKEAEAIPWDIPSVHIIAPDIIRIYCCDKPIIIKDLVIIHRATGWFEIL